MAETLSPDATTPPGSLNPMSGAPLPPVGASTPDDAAQAIATGRAAQEAWAEITVDARADCLHRFATRVLERRGEIAQILSDETGRSPSECMLSEVSGIGDAVKSAIKAAHAALAPERISLSKLDHPNKKLTVEAVPRGVVGIIAPWNYPFSNFLKNLFPALLAGNAVVLKPSEHTPRSGAWLQAQCAGIFPDGLVGVVQGRGPIGAALIDHGVDAIAFTGSVATGRKVAAHAGNALIPSSVELGGKDAAIVLADCDLERTVAGIAYWSMHNAGQNCAAIERVYVEAAIYESFVDALTRAIGKLRVAKGEGISELGPLQNPAQLAIVEKQVRAAIDAGAKCRVGGKATGIGYGYEPTLLTDVHHGMDIMVEETFGPVVCVMPVDDAEAGIANANDSRFGLNGSIWTRNTRRGAELARRLECGVVLVNNHAITGTFSETPWTGTKETGSGVAASKWAYPTFVRRRTLMVDTGRQPDPWWFPADENLAQMADALAERGLGKFSALLRLGGLLGKRVKAVRAICR